jgi:hypothetical protein
MLDLPKLCFQIKKRDVHRPELLSSRIFYLSQRDKDKSISAL